MLFNIASICLIIIFLILPLEHLKNKKIKVVIKEITNYTCGVYCLHKKIRNILCNKINILKINNIKLKDCFVLYLICYFIGFFGVKIFGKTNLKYLFI